MTEFSFPASKSVTMMACETIVANFKDNIAELSLVRDNWTEEYALDLETRLKADISQYLGVDQHAAQKKATIQVNMILNEATKDVNFLYKQINTDFEREPARRDAILQTLGFTSYWKSATSTSQVGMINLLQTYSQNLPDELKQEINAKGISMSLLERIPTYLEQLNTANNKQEQLKSTTPELTEEANQALYGIFQEVKSMAKVAKAFYISDPAKKKQFTFSYILRNLR